VLLSSTTTCIPSRKGFLQIEGGSHVQLEENHAGSHGLAPTIFNFQKVTYNFEVPEATSILLLGGGLILLAAMLRRRTRL